MLPGHLRNGLGMVGVVRGRVSTHTVPDLPSRLPVPPLDRGSRNEERKRDRDDADCPRLGGVVRRARRDACAGRLGGSGSGIEQGTTSLPCRLFVAVEGCAGYTAMRMREGRTIGVAFFLR